MQRLNWIELVFGVVPESLIFIFGIYIFSNTLICKKRLFLSALIISISTYIIKLLPIQFGVHMLILIMALVGVSSFINHVEIIKAVTSALLLIIIRLITEWISLLIMRELLNISIDVFLDNPLIKVLYVYPSTFMFFLVVFIVYIFKKKNCKERVI
ncbi:MAG TPA: hypothetical protein PK733_16065 [Clostridiales bacterium]|nr:hypothetical protein [Clostridiales bacterium]